MKSYMERSFFNFKSSKPLKACQGKLLQTLYLHILFTQPFRHNSRRKNLKGCVFFTLFSSFHADLLHEFSIENCSVLIKYVIYNNSCLCNQLQINVCLSYNKDFSTIFYYRIPAFVFIQIR